MRSEITTDQIFRTEFSTFLKSVIIGVTVGALMTACGAEDDAWNPEEFDTTEQLDNVDQIEQIDQSIRRSGTTVVPNGSFGTVVQTNDNVRGPCSGVIVGDRVVLTSGHCFCKSDSSDPCNDKTAYADIWYGTSWTKRRFRGRSFVHPNWARDYNDDYDLAVVVLNERISDFTTDARVSPSLLRTSNPSNNQQITVVGFGYTGNDCQNTDLSTKRRNTDRVDAVNSRVFLLDRRITCDGDSGGGAFDSSGRLAGIVKGGAWNLFQGDRTKLISVSNNRSWVESFPRPDLKCNGDYTNPRIQCSVELIDPSSSIRWKRSNVAQGSWNGRTSVSFGCSPGWNYNVEVSGLIDGQTKTATTLVRCRASSR